MALGKKTGGRKRGTPNARTAERKAEIAASGEMPLEYALRIMRDPEAANERRDWACGQAMRFCHPALAPVEWKPRGDEPPKGADDPAARAPASGDDLNQIVARFNTARAVKSNGATGPNGTTQH